VAAENAEAHGVIDRVTVRQTDLLALPEDLKELAPFDVITANPPYVAEADEAAPSLRYEPRGALYAGRDGLDAIRRLIPAAPPLLADGGAFIMEFGAGQADAVRDLIVSAGAFAEPVIRRDQAHIERIAVSMKKG